MRTKFKAWAEPYLNEHKEIMIVKEDYSSIFDAVLEIGAGKGLFITEMAKKYPNKKFVAIEKNVTCAGITAKKIVDKELNNVFLIHDDAYFVLEAIKENSIEQIFLNFSDPWPKKRHHKRRLTSENFLSLYRKALKKDSLIAFKTDNLDLFDYSIEMFKENNFIIVKEDRNYNGDDEFDVISEYEANFREKGQPIYRLIVK